jgi:hypothetical protein
MHGNEKVASLEALSDVNAFNIRNRRNYTHKICKDELMTMSFVLYFRKNFFLIEELNFRIQGLISSGLIDYWLRESLQNFKDGLNNEPKTLNITELRGSFAVLFIGYIMAFLVFMCELLISKYF